MGFFIIHLIGSKLLLGIVQSHTNFFFISLYFFSFCIQFLVFQFQSSLAFNQLFIEKSLQGCIQRIISCQEPKILLVASFRHPHAQVSKYLYIKITTKISVQSEEKDFNIKYEFSLLQMYSIDSYIMCDKKERIQIPILSEQQVWFRNREFKNWGNLYPHCFSKGRPFFIIGSKFSVFVLVFYLLLTTIMNQKSHNLVYLSCSVYLFALFLFWHSDSGIVSNSYPILNIEQLNGQKGFCKECKVFRQGQINHCHSCQVCMSNTYYHSNLLGKCLTSSNLWISVLLFMSIIIHSVICLIY